MLATHKTTTLPPLIILQNDQVNWHINNLNETQTVRAIIDDYFGIIHNDSDETCFIDFFKNIVTTYQSDFDDKSLQEKVNLLFDHYVGKSLPYVYGKCS